MLIKNSSKLLFFVLLLSAFSLVIPQDNKIIAEFGDVNISLQEFRDEYIKNEGSLELAKDDSLSEMKEFLDLYVNYRMKLADAKDRGYEDNPDVWNEYNDYKKQVGKTYLIEKKIVTPALKEMHKRRMEELRVKHILIKDGKNKKEFADSLLQSILSGKSKFEDVSDKYNEDAYAKNRGGDIYWITAGKVVKPFEDAIYEAPVGEVYPQLVKTRFGYHIIKVTERQERKPLVEVTHIMMNPVKKDTIDMDSADVVAKLRELKSQIKTQEDFEQTARKYSIDQQTAMRGGEIGWLERGRLVLEADSVIFKMNVGEVSDVVKTPFGYHLFRVNEVRDHRTYEEEEKELRDIHKRAYYEYDLEQAADSYRDEVGYKFNNSLAENVEKSFGYLDMGEGLFNSDEFRNIKDSVIYSIGEENYDLEYLIQNTMNDARFNTKNVLAKNLSEAAKKISRDQVLEAKALKLDIDDPEFDTIMKDYLNGIYIFKLQEEVVWNKAEIDSTKLPGYYEKNKEKFKYPDRVDVSEIFVKVDTTVNYIYKKLRDGLSFDSAAVKYTERTAYREKAGRLGVMNADKDKLTKTAWELEEGEYSEPFWLTGGWRIVKLNEKLPSRIKTFEEAKSEVYMDYQENQNKQLEEEYLKQLKDKYNPKINYSLLNEVFKEN